MCSTPYPSGQTLGDTREQVDPLLVPKRLFTKALKDVRALLCGSRHGEGETAKAAAVAALSRNSLRDLRECETCVQLHDGLAAAGLV